ncbi:hypothetical protein EWM64_g8937 [Hericium alpestre]|uniref:F-box domain-containing protein n=1 Tax=Hericium alpestre TaxID=135208 RepID=A0A4Y9ZM77_9AGAM|nr:hypothetical protein EWM64_g8937 [Hericium alpestre]
MNEMLARSKQAPFTLVACIAHDHKVYDVALKAIGPEHIWRMKGIHLIDRTPSRIQGGPLGSRRIEVLASLKQPAPMLESLTLEGITKSDEALPQDIFALTLPRLRCFSFLDFRTMVWEASYLCNLTDLELGFQANVPLSKLLALLKKSPTLENLKISRRSHSVGTPEAHPPDRGVILLSLETLYYSGPPDPTCIDFLASLTIPSAAQVHFSFWGGEVEKMLPIIPLVTAFLGTKDPRTRPSPSRILLGCDQFPDGSVCVGLKTWFKEDSSSSRQPPFSIAWNPHNFMPIAHVPFVQQLLGSFDLRTVTHLMLESQYPDSAIYDTLKDMFRSMPVVREITLNGYGIVPLLGILETMHVVRPDPEIPDIGGQVRVAESSLFFPVFFPGLAYLTVVAAPFDRGRPGDRDWDPLLGVGNALLSLVQKRSAMGARIRTLSITECCGSEAMADSFREHVEILLHRRHRLAGA